MYSSHYCNNIHSKCANSRLFLWTQLVFNENKWHKFALTLALMSTATQLLLPQTTPPKADLRDPQPTIKWTTQSMHASALFKTHFFVNNSLKQTQRLRPELKIDVAVI